MQKKNNKFSNKNIHLLYGVYIGKFNFLSQLTWKYRYIKLIQYFKIILHHFEKLREKRQTKNEIF